MSDVQVKIEVDNNAIVCNVKEGNVKGGNVYVQAGSNQDDSIHFIGNGVKFALAFANFPSGAALWPFQEAQPTWPVPQFRGTLSPVAQTSYVKYTVSVPGVPPLDPIIIIDKKN